MAIKCPLWLGWGFYLSLFITAAWLLAGRRSLRVNIKTKNLPSNVPPFTERLL
jgi:hypothetical protein